MRVLLVPPANDSNHYLASLRAALVDRGVEVLAAEPRFRLPVLGALSRGPRPDVLHVHWLDQHLVSASRAGTLLRTLRLLVELLVVRLLGVRVVWTVHNLLGHDRWFPRWERFWRGVVARHLCDALVVHCPRARERVREAYAPGETPVAVVPHGSYVDRYPDGTTRTAARERLGLAPAETAFVFLGRVQEYKRVPHLVETFGRLDAPNARLVVAGAPASEALRERVRTLADRTPRVDARLEFVPDDEVATYLRAADAVVLPYRDVLTSGSAVLAMSFERPVVVPRTGCLRDLVRDGREGLTYDPDDPEGLGGAMERALSADLAAMGDRAGERATGGERDWSRVAASTRAVYRDAVRDADRGRDRHRHRHRARD